MAKQRSSAAAAKSPRRAPPSGAGSIAVRPLVRADWPHLEALFGTNGACGGCWCMHWRVLASGPAWQGIKGARNRRSLQRLVASGQARGVLAFAGDQPVGWCALGRYRDFPRLARARTLKRPDRERREATTWSIVCFVVARAWRRRGVAKVLVAGAVAHAFACGAEEVEAYPILPRKPGEVPDVFAFTGLPSLFEDAGFARVNPDPGMRSIYLLARR